MCHSRQVDLVKYRHAQAMLESVVMISLWIECICHHIPCGFVCCPSDVVVLLYDCSLLVVAFIAVGGCVMPLHYCSFAIITV